MPLLSPKKVKPPDPPAAPPLPAPAEPEPITVPDPEPTREQIAELAKNIAELEENIETFRKENMPESEFGQLQPDEIALVTERRRVNAQKELAAQEAAALPDIHSLSTQQYLALPKETKDRMYAANAKAILDDMKR
jgi:hypothetical protein